MSEKDVAEAENLLKKLTEELANLEKPSLELEKTIQNGVQHSYYEDSVDDYYCKKHRKKVGWHTPNEVEEDLGFGLADKLSKMEAAYEQHQGVVDERPQPPPEHRPVDEPIDKDKIEHFISSIMESLNDIFHMDLQLFSLTMDKKNKMLALKVGTDEKEIIAFLEPQEGVWVLKDIETKIPDKEREMKPPEHKPVDGKVIPNRDPEATQNKDTEKMDNWKPCPSCGGTGEALAGGVCPRCGGEGYIDTY
jgi:hypothetical protein